MARLVAMIMGPSRRCGWKNRRNSETQAAESILLKHSLCPPEQRSLSLLVYASHLRLFSHELRQTVPQHTLKKPLFRQTDNGLNRSRQDEPPFAPDFDQAITALLRDILNGGIPTGIVKDVQFRFCSGRSAPQCLCASSKVLVGTKCKYLEYLISEPQLEQTLKELVNIATSRDEDDDSDIDDDDEVEMLENPTWKGILRYIHTGEITFAALASSNPTSAQPEDACSPKPVYKLADEVGPDSLKTTALAAIKQRMTTENVLNELFNTDFSSRYAEVHNLEIDSPCKRFSSVNGFDDMVERLIDGDLTNKGCSKIFQEIMKRKPQYPGPSSTGGGISTRPTMGHRNGRER